MYYCFLGTYFHSRVLPGTSELKWHVPSVCKNLLCFGCFIIIPTILIAMALWPLLPSLGLSHLSSVRLLTFFSSTSFLLFFSVCCSPWITPLLPDSLSSAALNGHFRRRRVSSSGSDCLSHTQRGAAIQHSGRNYRTRPGGEVDETEHFSGAFWLHLTSQ